MTDPNRDQTEDTLLALGTLLAGLGTAAAIILYAKGRAKDVYPFAAAAAITTAVVGSARVLGGETARVL